MIGLLYIKLEDIRRILLNKHFQDDVSEAIFNLAGITAKRRKGHNINQDLRTIWIPMSAWVENKTTVPICISIFFRYPIMADFDSLTPKT